MKFQRPYLTRFSMLLILGFLFLWVAASEDIGTVNTSLVSCENMEICFEEELLESLSSDFFFPGLFVAAPVSSSQCSRTCPVESLHASSGSSSGWMMPLLI